jgi:hypothetical protein
LVLLVVLVAPVDVLGQKGPDGSAMVATYDDGGITVDEFVTMFHQAAANMPDHNMMEYKRELLAYMATNELLGREAQLRGYVDEKGEWDAKVVETKEAAMVNQLRRDVVLKGIKVTEDDLRTMYDRSTIRRLTRVITLGNRADADMIMEKLAGGADFIELVREWSLETDSATWDGLLAWMKVGDAPEDVEKLIFELELGEIGGPIETLQGYSIFRVDSLYYKTDIRTYEEMRPLYRSKALARKRTPVNIAFMDSVAKARGLSFDENTVNMVIERFQSEGWHEDDKPGRESSFPEFTPDEYARTILSYEGGSGNLHEYLRYVRDQHVNPAYFLAGPEEMERGLAGFARRNLELTVAYEMGMDEVPSVRGQVREKAISVGIVKMMVDVAGGEEAVNTTRQDWRDFYERNKWKYTEPGAIVISIATITDMEVVDELYEDMVNGVPIEKISQDYRWVLDEARTSERMVLTDADREDHPEIFNTARRMRIGAVSEPIPVPARGDTERGLSVIRLLEREPSKVIPFEAIEEEVKTDLNLEVLLGVSGKLEEFKQSVRDKYNYKVDEEVFNSIRF